ncbi:transcriptional regulator NrdR [bacterium]|nr:transcriptional regulator NrdR [bacterium]
MRCPNCLSTNTSVIDSRDVDDDRAIRRRRECEKCKTRFTTYERVELTNILVIKKDGSRESYDRDKLLSGIIKACEKRPISKDEIDKSVSDIERKLQATCETEVSSKLVGDLVSHSLKKLDKVAYIRFASVYKSFDDLESFEEELKGLLKKPKTKGVKK